MATAGDTVVQKQSVDQLIADAKKTTEDLRTTLLQSFLDETWEPISNDFITSTPNDRFKHLTTSDKTKFLTEEKNQLEKRNDLLHKYNDEILTKQVANLREALRHSQEELAELRRRYGPLP